MAVPERQAEQNPKATDVRPYQHPFRALRHEMDDLIDRFFSDSWFLGGPLTGEDLTTSKEALVVPEVDIVEKKDRYVVTAELPGIKAEDIDVQVENGMMTVTGEKKSSYEKDEDDAHVIERRYGHFERRLPMPRGVDEDKIKAQFDDGILTITLPKLKEDRRTSRKVKID